MKKHTYYTDDCRPVNMTSAREANENECCVVCGRETAVCRNTHVCFREDYVHGGGQLCMECFAGLYTQERAGQKINERF